MDFSVKLFNITSYLNTFNASHTVTNTIITSVSSPPTPPPPPLPLPRVPKSSITHNLHWGLLTLSPPPHRHSSRRQNKVNSITLYVELALVYSGTANAPLSSQFIVWIYIPKHSLRVCCSSTLIFNLKWIFHRNAILFDMLLCFNVTHFLNPSYHPSATNQLPALDVAIVSAFPTRYHLPCQVKIYTLYDSRVVQNHLRYLHCCVVFSWRRKKLVW